MPEEAALAAAMASDNVKVEKLVKEFLVAQNLRILPKSRFGLAVTEFVDKEDKHAKIVHRKELAGRLGIAVNALRIKAHRIRVSLQVCVENCLGQE